MEEMAVATEIIIGLTEQLRKRIKRRFRKKKMIWLKFEERLE
jgi:hypothetical protein